MFNIPTWEGRGLLECNPALIFTMIDRMLGGPGNPPDNTRPLTDIEQGLVQQLMRHVGELYRDAWRTVTEVEFQLDSLETNPLFTQIVSQNETVALITCSARIGATEGMMNICLPHMVLEQVMDKLTTRTWYAGQIQPTDSRNVDRLRQRVNRVSVPVRVEIGETSIALADLLELQVGDCIQLETKANKPMRVFVGPFPKFLGRAGLTGRKLAVMIDSVLEGGEVDGQ
jgi:flagellar motor switch protein FliM